MKIALVDALFTQVRGRVILRSSAKRSSPKFAKRKVGGFIADSSPLANIFPL
jgi:hypothetical protein